MINDCLVSVIIPTYKGDKFVCRAVESVLNQNYSNLEVIVVDDNGQDTECQVETYNVLSKFFEDDRFNYYKHQINKNGSAARNTGFLHSNGKYIAYLDDDDWFVEDKISLQVDFLEKNPEYGGVYGGRYENGKKIIYKKQGDLSIDILLYKILPCTCTLMIRREIIEQMNGWDEAYKRHQDFDFLLRFFQISKIGVIKKPLFYIKKENSNNLTPIETIEKQKRVYLNQFEPIINKVTNNKKRLKRKIYGVNYTRIICGYLRNKKKNDAKRVYKEAYEKCGFIIIFQILNYSFKYFLQKISRVFRK